jgi:DNA-binding transcriptional LysR family regulator
MTNSSLDPELLRAFVAVAELRSFTRAAERLARTQAAVSLQVKRLEDRLGIVLLRRTKTRVDLSPVGEEFLPDARRILALNQQTLARLSSHKATGRVRIGVMEDYGTKLLPSLLASAAEQFPLVEVEMEIGLTARMLKRLGTSFDAVFAMHHDGAHEGDLICREKAVWATAKDAAAEHLEPLPLALSDRDCLFRQWATQALDESGKAWRLAYVSTSLAAVEAIVRQGLAVTVVKGSMLGPDLRALRSGSSLPRLPSAEIRLHKAAGITHPASLVVDHLARGLRSRSAEQVKVS